MSISAGGLQHAAAEHTILLGTRCEEDEMPVILELEDYEADLVVDALVEGRIRLMKDWGDRYRSTDRSPFEDDLALIDADIVAVADIREHLKEGIGMLRLCKSKARDTEQKVGVAWHHKHGWLPTDDFEEAAVEDVRDQDQMSPGTWAALPEGFEISFDETDAWPYSETDPEEKIVIGSADTQADGTKVAFYTYDINGRCNEEPDDSDRFEITEAGLAALASEEVFNSPLTDAAIFDLAADYSNHTLTAESGAKFAVIEYQDLIEFVREVEMHVLAAAEKQIRENDKARIASKIAG